MKLKLLIFSALITFGAWAQEGPYISDAIISLDKNNDVPEAYGFIKEAQKIIEGKNFAGVKDKNLQKYYYYQALINMRIAQNTDPEIRALNENALDESVEYFQKSLAFEKQIGKDKYTEESNYFLQQCANMIFSKGAAMSDSGNKEGAADAFFEVYNLKKDVLAQPFIDTTSLFNAVLLSEQAGETNPEYTQKALKGNEALLEMGYTGISWTVMDSTGQRVTAGSKEAANRVISQQPARYSDPQPSQAVTADIYKALVRLYKKTDNQAKYREILKLGREKFPNDDFFVKYELQDFLDSKDYESAMKNLDLAIASDTTNPLFPYVKGVIQQTEMKDKEGAKASYEKALSIDPMYYDALYMRGVLYVDEANAYSEKINELPLSAKKKYESLKAEQKKVFEQALPFFEKAYSIKQDDRDVVNALKEVYYKLDMPEKSLEMNKKLQELSAE
jgi:tetratricopeptide (TPR) repeat protein